jgi:hypothetical protein
VRCQYRFDEPREPRVEIVLAQGGKTTPSLDLRAGHPGLPQHLEVMGHRRFGVQREVAAGLRFSILERFHYLQANRIAECVKYPSE